MDELKFNNLSIILCAGKNTNSIKIQVIRKNSVFSPLESSIKQ